MIPLESAEFGIRELMRLGEHVEVLSPAALRTQMLATLRQMMLHYSPPGSRTIPSG